MGQVDVPWRRDAVVYEIYVRSFADSDGDGVGDLPGITARLPYLFELGVDAVWLTPFYASPMADHGYDVADPRAVDPTFGTLADFDLLLAMDREPGTVGALATRLGLTKQAVSRLADRLVILGYCDRRRDEINRRQVLLRTSEAGARAAAVLRAGLDRADQRFLSGLGAAERETDNSDAKKILGDSARRIGMLAAAQKALAITGR